MAVTVTCPECANSLPVNTDLLGKKIRCKSCQHVFVAAATKAAVGGRSREESERPAGTALSRNGSANGVHKKPAGKGKPPANAKSNTLLFAGGGTALVAVAAALIYIFVIKGDGESAKNDSGVANNNTMKVAEGPGPETPKDANAATNSDVQPKPKDEAATPKVERPSNTVRTLRTGFAPSPRSLPAAISKEAMEKVLKSAVMLRVRGDSGGGEGSGWMAEPGIIITNAHVVGMKEPATTPPHSIRVFLDSGLPSQREMNGKLIGIDRDNDLAVVQIKADKLPAPLPVCPSGELTEGTPLYVMGFPLGSQLAEIAGHGESGGNRVLPTVKLRNTVITSRIAYKSGGVKLIQIEGGASPGNSGGAIIDTAGNVRAILVAGRPGTQIIYCIPSEYAIYLLRGRMMSLTPGQSYKGGSTGIRQPFKALIADPMERIQSVSMTVWAGPPGNRVRPATDRQPAPLPGDSPWTEVPLIYEKGGTVRYGESRPASGECDLPQRKEGQVYWAQPRYTRNDGSVTWGEAIVTDFCGLPVDRGSANLVVKHQPGTERTVHIQSKTGIGLGPEGSAIRVGMREVKAQLTEKTRNTVSDGANVHFNYSDFGFADEDINEYLRENEKDMMAAVKGMSIETVMTNRGFIREPKTNLTHVPAPFRPTLASFNRQIIGALESFAMALPGKDVSANETWTYDLPFVVLPPARGAQAQDISFKMRYKLLGTRERNGRNEAVISFEGKITKGAGGSGSRTAGESDAAGTFEQVDEAAARREGVWGTVHGAALIDLETGLARIGRSSADFAINLKVKVANPANPSEEREVDATLGGLLETNLQRLFNKGDKKDVPEFVLPDQAFLHNPFVGVPDPNNIVAVEGGGSGGTGVAQQDTGTSPLEMKKEVLDKVKAAACLIRTKRDGGGGDGSGWLAEPGIVITNAHVIGMVERAARPPTSVDVYFDAGLPTVKKFPAKILTVDHDRDLAVLELPTKEGLPQPMPIVPSTDLYLSQRLFVIGFPLGQRLGAELGDGIDPLTTQLKVRDTSVAGRHDNKRTGFLKYIQTEGGLTPGNSGGAIVDMNGAVRCVAVAIIPNTQIGFAIPSEYAARLLTGYPLEMKMPLAYLDGTTPKQAVEIQFGDPLKRVKNVYIDYWVGPPGNPRRGSITAPKPRPGDLKRQSVPCTYDAEKVTARGEFPLPEADPGLAYWIQPRFTDGSGKEVWGDAVFYAPDGPPLERRDVLLQAKFDRGAERLIDVRTEAEYRYVYIGQDIGFTNHLFVTLAEKVMGYNAAAKRHMVNYQYTDIRFGEPRTQGEFIKVILAVMQAPDLIGQIRRLVTVAGYKSDGVLTTWGVPDPTPIPLRLRYLFTEFNTQVVQSIQTMSIRLPNKIVKYNETWEQDSNLLIEAKSRLEPSLFKLEMRYLGLRERGGRQEAVIEINGSIRQDANAKASDVRELKNKEPGTQDDDASKGKDAPKGKDTPRGKGKDARKGVLQPVQVPVLPPSDVKGKKPLYGKVRGFAFVDVESGVVRYCKMFLDIDAEILHKDRQSGAEIPVRSGGTIEMEMTRRLSQTG